MGLGYDPQHQIMKQNETILFQVFGGQGGNVGGIGDDMVLLCRPDWPQT
jgi:hypothetical protein